MTIASYEAALHEMQRPTVLARATDNVVLRADLYRLAEHCREQARNEPARSERAAEGLQS